MASPNTKKFQTKRSPLSSSTYKHFHRRYKRCPQCKIRFNIKNVRDRLEIHHIIPVHLGGTNTYKNLECKCGACHYDDHADEFTEEAFFGLRENQ